MVCTVLSGDCLEQLAKLEPESVDAIVTDPPYGLGFMGKAWDELPPGREWAEACLRVLKPGGHLLAFGGSRTWHRLAVAVEDAGFEIRDSIAWLYGSGFPKSLDVSKAIDKRGGSPHLAATPAAEQWQGWGTSLKPAFEPVVMARKPLSGTVAANVLEHGTGALNIDACRIGTSGGGTHCGNRDGSGKCRGHNNAGRSTSGETFHGVESSGGRWPANVMLDEHTAPILDQQAADVSRFFYVAKAPKRERPNVGGVQHPTVKPLALMRWLVRLVTPPGGVVCDPFAGSGTTIEAALLEGFDVIGIEREAEYLPLIEARIARAGLLGSVEESTAA